MFVYLYLGNHLCNLKVITNKFLYLFKLLPENNDLIVSSHGNANIGSRFRDSLIYKLLKLLNVGCHAAVKI